MKRPALIAASLTALAALTAMGGAAQARPGGALAAAPDSCAIQVERNARKVSLRATADRRLTGRYEMVAYIHTPTGETTANLNGRFGAGIRPGGFSRIDVERENSFRATLRVFAPDGRQICQDTLRGNLVGVRRAELRNSITVLQPRVRRR